MYPRTDSLPYIHTVQAGLRRRPMSTNAEAASSPVSVRFSELDGSCQLGVNQIRPIDPILDSAVQVMSTTSEAHYYGGRINRCSGNVERALASRTIFGWKGVDLTPWTE